MDAAQRSIRSTAFYLTTALLVVVARGRAQSPFTANPNAVQLTGTQTIVTVNIAGSGNFTITQSGSFFNTGGATSGTSPTSFSVSLGSTVCSNGGTTACNGSITLHPTAVSGTSQDLVIPVTLTPGSGGSNTGVIVPNPYPVILSANTNQSVSTNVTLTTSSANTIGFSFTTTPTNGQSWLSVQVSSNQISSSSSVNMTVFASALNLTTSQTGSITITPNNGGPQTFISVNLSINGSSTYSLNPPSIAFSSPNDVNAKTVVVFNSASLTTYNAIVTSCSSGNFLLLNGLNQAFNQAVANGLILTVTNLGSFATGSYSCNVQVSNPSNQNDFVNLPVTLSVNGGGSNGQYVVSQNQINYTSAAGSFSTQPQNIAISSTSGATLYNASFTSSSGVQFITMNSSTLQTIPNQLVANGLNIALNQPQTLPPGTYSGTITLSNPNGTGQNTTISVSLTVTSYTVSQNTFNFQSPSGTQSGIVTVSSQSQTQFVAISTSNGNLGNWITLSQAGIFPGPTIIGSTGQAMSILLNGGAIPTVQGYYTGQVKISNPSNSNDFVTITVNLQVGSGGGTTGVIAANPPYVTLSANTNQSVSTNVTLTTSSATAIGFSFTTTPVNGQSWLTVQVVGNSQVSSSNSVTLNVFASALNLTTSQTGSITITPNNGGAQTVIPVNFNINGNSGNSSISSNPVGRVFAVEGNGCAAGAYTTPQTLQWTPGASCTVTFVSPHSVQLGTQYVMTGWLDGSTANPRTITASQQPATYTASFKTQHQLTALANPPEGGSVSGGGWVDAGTATLTATANSGYRFVNWSSGSGTQTDNPIAVQVNGPQTITANFFPLTNTPPGNWIVTMPIASGAWAYSMNSFGQVVGQSENRAFLWTPILANSSAGTLIDLSNSSPGNSSVAAGINDRGQVILGPNTYPPGPGPLVPSPAPLNLWTPTVPHGTSGTTTIISAPSSPVPNTLLPALNNFGQVATYVNGSPAVWTPATPNGTTGVTTPNTQFQGLRALNSFGQAIMSFSPATFLGGPPLLFTPAARNGTTGTFTAIAGLSGTAQDVLAGINDSGVVVGYSCVTQASGGCQNTGFIWTPTSPNGTTGNIVQMLLPSGFIRVMPTAINASGSIVGTMSPASGSTVPFLYSNGTYYDLSAISGVPLGATPAAINQIGQIVLNGIDASIGYTVYLVSPPATPALTPPKPLSVDPSSGTGFNQTLVFTFADSRGWQDLGVLNVLINSALDGRNACYLAYSRLADVLYLVNDAGTALSAGLPLGSGSVTNGQCTVFGAGSSISGNGATLTLILNLSFKSSFSGNKVIYTAARDVLENNSGWQALGVWQVPGAVQQTTTAVEGMAPAQGNSLGPTTFMFTFSDTKGHQDLGVQNILLNSGLDGRHACYLAYAHSIRVIYLVNDNGDALLPGQPITASGTLSNNQCTVTWNSSALTAAANSLSLTLAIGFSPSFSGSRIFYLASRDLLEANNSGWQALGTWQVPGSRTPKR